MHLKKHHPISLMPICSFLIFILLLLSQAGLAQFSYPGAIQVNETTEGHQDSPEIAVNHSGTILVVFESEINGDDENIFSVSYDGKSFREFFWSGPTTDTASLEAFPDDDRFVISYTQNNRVQYCIVSCRDGVEQIERIPTPVRDDIKGVGKRPDVAISRDGSIFAIGWHTKDVLVQFFDAVGNVLTEAISIADILAYDQAEISLKFRPDSVLVATWYSEKGGNFGTTNKDRDIWFQLFDCRPVWQGGEPVKLLETQQRANGDLSATDPVWFIQEYPEVDVFDDGRFVIMWQDFPYSGTENGSDGSDKGAYFRIFNADGSPQTGDLLISEHTLNFQKDADIRIRQSDRTIHFIYEDAYEATPEKAWLAYPSYRVFDDQGNPQGPSVELSDQSYGTDCRIAITEPVGTEAGQVLFVWETKDIENVDDSGRAVLFHELTEQTAVSEEFAAKGTVPEDFQLLKNYPNPFNSSTVFSYAVPSESFVKINLFNSLGQHIRTLFEGKQFAGQHSLQVNFSNLPGGVYFCRMKTNWGVHSLKVLYLK